GKTTVGRLLAGELGWKFYDADDFHPPANVEKMSRGVALDDDDRRPWLEVLRGLVRDSHARGENAVLACSALKESYRRLLLADERTRLVYLKGDYDTVKGRVANRRGHYMKPEMLDSQFAALEEPAAASHLDASLPPGEIVEEIRRRLGA
ncbi:MAG: gluconokinase, partial [Acidobacteria bacterium]|nr:gluconokinase [Acidobacteriota bacterium]